MKWICRNIRIHAGMLPILSGKFSPQPANLIAHALEDCQTKLLVTYTRCRRIFKALVNPHRIVWEKRTGFFGVIADRENEIELLPDELVRRS